MRAARLAVAMAACSLVFAGGAEAATLTLGSQFQGNVGEPIDFPVGGATIAQTSLPSPLIAVAPVDGTVVNWRFAGSGPSFTPQVIRPGGGLYAVASSGPSQAAAVGYAVTGPFPLNLPIRRGDLFGYSEINGFGAAYTRADAGIVFFQPPLDPGGNPEAPDATNPNAYELALSATVRYCVVPDLRKMKPNAARAALTAADCTVGQAKKSKKRRKKKRVLSQEVPPGSQVSDTLPIDFKISRKRKR